MLKFVRIPFYRSVNWNAHLSAKRGELERKNEIDSVVAHKINIFKVNTIQMKAIWT